MFDYRLLYRVRPEEVIVVAYVHGARDFATWREEERRCIGDEGLV